MYGIKIQSEYNDLDKYQYRNGKIIYYKKNTDIWHNPYGPAFISNDGSKSYWIENKRSRLNGPAVILFDGKEFYYINGKQLSKEEFEIEKLKILGKEHLICLL